MFGNTLCCEKDEEDSCREDLKYQEAQARLPLDGPVSAADLTGKKHSWGGVMYC